MKILIAIPLIVGSLAMTFLIEGLLAGTKYFRAGDVLSVDAGVRDTVRCSRGESLSSMHPSEH